MLNLKRKPFQERHHNIPSVGKVPSRGFNPKKNLLFRNANSFSRMTKPPMKVVDTPVKSHKNILKNGLQISLSQPFQTPKGYHNAKLSMGSPSGVLSSLRMDKSTLSFKNDSMAIVDDMEPPKSGIAKIIFGTEEKIIQKVEDLDITMLDSQDTVKSSKKESKDNGLVGTVQPKLEIQTQGGMSTSALPQKIFLHKEVQTFHSFPPTQMNNPFVSPVLISRIKSLKNFSRAQSLSSNPSQTYLVPYIPQQNDNLSPALSSQSQPSNYSESPQMIPLDFSKSNSHNRNFDPHLKTDGEDNLKLLTDAVRIILDEKRDKNVDEDFTCEEEVVGHPTKEKALKRVTRSLAKEKIQKGNTVDFQVLSDDYTHRIGRKRGRTEFEKSTIKGRKSRGRGRPKRGRGRPRKNFVNRKASKRKNSKSKTRHTRAKLDNGFLRRSVIEEKFGNPTKNSLKSVDVLKQWVLEHLEFPYPTKDEKDDLKRRSGLSLVQITNWCSNFRKRLWRPAIEERILEKEREDIDDDILGIDSPEDEMENIDIDDDDNINYDELDSSDVNLGKIILRSSKKGSDLKVINNVKNNGVFIGGIGEVNNEVISVNKSIKRNDYMSCLPLKKRRKLMK